MISTVPKITLDTNCVINLFDRQAASPTSRPVLSEIIRHALSNRVDIAVTTRVEADLLNDKNPERKAEMLRVLQMLPVVGSVARWGFSRWDSGDIYVSDENKARAEELQRLLFPGLTSSDKRYKNKISDVDHLLGHMIGQRDQFVTDDTGILTKRAALLSGLGLAVMSPVECLRSLEQAEIRKELKPLSTLGLDQKYQSSVLKGTVAFDYSNNNGKFGIGEGLYFFCTRWSKASDVSIHGYRDEPSIEGIARAKGCKEIQEITDAQIFDYSSRTRTVHEGEILLWRNTNGFYAATKIVDVKDDSRRDDRDELTFEYVIQPDGSPNFGSDG